MQIKDKDFVKIEFTGRVKGGEVFDSNTKEELEKLHQGHGHETQAKPFVFSIGRGMFLKSIDEFLIGKETGKNYDIELTPENAFGPRVPALVQTIPMKIFHEQRINPVVGASLNFDGRIGKILTVSGGRVMVDFNHSLAGKNVEYKIKTLGIVSDINEKVSALNDFFFRKEFKFEVKENKLLMDVEKKFVRLVEIFKDQFKEILNLDLEIKEVEDKKEEENQHQHH